MAAFIQEPPVMFVWRESSEPADVKFGAAWLLLALALLAGGCESRTQATPDQTAAVAAAAPATSATSPEGEWFVKTGCAKCHAVSVYGVTPEAQIGPDLALAVEDVKTRFGVPLEEFFDNPSGTMALVLSSQIQLTPEEKKVAIRKLHEAFEAHQKAGGIAASH
jgi:hypothetical protein